MPRDIQVNDVHRQRATEIVGSMSDTALQASLTKDIARSLALYEAKGFEDGHDMATGGKIRVLRLLEYVYPDAETMEKDRAHWYVQGDRVQGAVRIRSTVLPLEVLG